MLNRVIPIFPLDLVLFPRQELPLRIFEPRYKQMVDDCMLGDGQFGVCLANHQSLSVNGWTAPRAVGTITKITKCENVGLDGLQIQIETMGRNPFMIGELIPPPMKRPLDYDPNTLEGHERISELHNKIGRDTKMYIQGRVQMLPEIDDNITLDTWQDLVALWKQKIIKSSPQTIDPQALDHLLEQYYLITEIPTIDYVYSLAALGAKDPSDLQPILEAPTMSNLVDKVKELFMDKTT